MNHKIVTLEPVERRARPRGRPRVEEQGTTVCTWLRPGEHDRLIALANKQETTVSALVRSFLILRLR